MSQPENVGNALPLLNEIEDPELRDGVVEVWETALAESTYDSVQAVPWVLDERVAGEYLIEHIADVAGIATDMVDRLEENRDVVIDRDMVIAASLLHDVSVLYEIRDGEASELKTRIPHPHYVVHLLASADLPLHLQHISLAHSGATSIEPQTLEAQIIVSADLVAAQAVYWLRDGSLV